MFQLHLNDLDELVLTVRDLNTREYIGEALAAYRSRAYRSAIMGTWIAVVYDIISKIRELAVLGDPAAVAFVAKLDAAIAQTSTNYVQAVQQLQSIESNLLTIALADFEFITAQDYSDLERLKIDRNLCAHPAFVTETALFQPSPEQVRTHIVHAIEHLLQHPPTQGKIALARLKSDLLQPSFPTDQKTVTEFMEQRYLKYAKRNFLEHLVTVLLKVIIKQSEVDLIGKEQAVLKCIIAFSIRCPDIYTRKSAEQLPKLTASSNDSELNRVFMLFKADKRYYAWLENPTCIKMAEIVKNYQYDQLTIESIIGAMEIDSLRPLFVARVAAFPPAHQEAILAAHMHQEFIDLALDLYVNVQHFRDASRIGQTVIVPSCSLFRAEHVQRVVDAARENYEIHGNNATSDILCNVFEATIDLLDVTKGAWQIFLRAMMKDKDPESRFAYPALRAKLEKAGIWPP